jgi:hypothetical protein
MVLLLVLGSGGVAFAIHPYGLDYRPYLMFNQTKWNDAFIQKS